MFKSKNKKMIYTPVTPNFTVYMYTWGLWGYKLHGHVIMMQSKVLATAIKSILKKRKCNNSRNKLTKDTHIYTSFYMVHEASNTFKVACMFLWFYVSIQFAW